MGGDRATWGDACKERPIVRFKTQFAAEAALAAVKAGSVFLDGIQLKGEWRGSGAPTPRPRKGDGKGKDDWRSVRAPTEPEMNSRAMYGSRGTFASRDDRRQGGTGGRDPEVSSRDLFSGASSRRSPRRRIHPEVL